MVTLVLRDALLRSFHAALGRSIAPKPDGSRIVIATNDAMLSFYGISGKVPKGSLPIQDQGRALRSQTWVLDRKSVV